MKQDLRRLFNTLETPLSKQMHVCNHLIEVTFVKLQMLDTLFEHLHSSIYNI